MTTLNCGHAPTADAGIGTGYGIDVNGYTLCYECATAFDMSAIANAKPGDALAFYLSGAPSDGALISQPNRWNQDDKITNWSGAEVLRLIYVESPSEYHPKRYARALDAQDREWYGVGPRESGTYMTFRPVTGATYLANSRAF